MTWGFNGHNLAGCNGRDGNQSVEEVLDRYHATSD